MQFQIQKAPKGSLVHIISGSDDASGIGLLKEEQELLAAQLKNGQSIQFFPRLDQTEFVAKINLELEAEELHETIRQLGASLQAELAKFKIPEIGIINHTAEARAAYHLSEGLYLANYQFLKYKSDAKQLKHALQYINISKSSINPNELKRLSATLAAVSKARDLVNEPLSYLSAEQLSEEIKALGKEALLKVSVYGKGKIEQLGMGGLLAVNKGSIDPPTFTIIEHKPAKALNKKPIVLIGKGIVYDTGGLSLKPTPNSMDKMKSDMGGAATVAAIAYAAGLMELPLHLIALIPATDNRPGQNAYVPGDVIKMYSGATVEVLNTDAEGRMVLADALHFAKKYEPELVLDFATLTGAAAAATGDVAMVTMGTAGAQVLQQLQRAGTRQHERMVALPLWKEYHELIKSEIADIKNVGGPKAGAITAGKFLEYFTEYPWQHFDIAGVAHRDGKKGYLTDGGTGVGIRMMLDFLQHYATKD